MRVCSACNSSISQEQTGEPFIVFKAVVLCYGCYVDLIPKIYSMSGAGDGGIIHTFYNICLKSSHNRSQRVAIKGYRKVFERLLYKYKFSCAHCNNKDVSRLTIDHVHPVSKGGTDHFSNLQILCRSCNSRKGVKI
jgi:hypothetical protein